MEKDLQAIVVEAKCKLDSVSNRPDWERVKATILGPNGSLTQIAKSIGKVAKEERPAFGQSLNRTKKELEEVFKLSLSSIEEKADLKTLGPAIDPSLPPILTEEHILLLTPAVRSFLSFEKSGSPLLKQLNVKQNGFALTH